ncbi:capsid protein [Bondarzewia berkeleyi partitivirus 1]|nr:capsid protein [Bondarzewia berkeleyi partitivirus 1]
MSADKVELALSKDGSLADLNQEDLKAYLQAQIKREAELASASSSSTTAINPSDRSVATQHRKKIVDAETKTAPVEKKTAVKFSDKSAAHALREVIGPDPFTDIRFVSNNLFIPDALYYSYIVEATDTTMMNTPKFVDAAQGFHPLVSRMYHSQLFFIKTFLAMDAAGILSDDVKDALNILLERLPLDTWVVPGPTVDYLNSIACSHTTVNGYGYISPFLPDTPRVSAGTPLFTSNIAGRVPNMIILGNQLHNWVEIAHAAAAAVPQTTRDSARFHPTAAPGNNARSYFLSEVYQGFHPFQGAGSAHPNGPTARGTFGNHVNALQRENLVSPFLLTPPLSNDRAVKVSFSNEDNLTYLSENLRIGAPLDEWPSFLYWNEIEFWSEVQSMMALYCRHLSGSLDLSSLSPSGPMAAHVVATAHTRVDLGAETGRYFPRGQDLSIQGEVRVRTVPPSDKIDAMTAPVNFSRILLNAAGVNRPVVANNYNRNAINLPRLGGPYFIRISPIQNVSNKSPVSGYKEVIASQYHSQTPLRSTIPDA